MEKGQRQRHQCFFRLPLDAALCERLGPLVPYVLATAGAKHMGAEVHVRGLVRLCTEGAEHSRGWRAQWSHDAAVLKHLHGDPPDGYSLRVKEVVATRAAEQVPFCWYREHRNWNKRESLVANMGDARARAMSPNWPLCIGDWSGRAGEVVCQSPHHKCSWYWQGHEVPKGIQQTTDPSELIPAQLSDSDSDSDSDVSIGGADQAEWSPAHTAATVLAGWGLGGLDPDEIPILLLPEPIVYLVIARQEWCDLFFRASWHKSLVGSSGRCWPGPMDMPVFQDVDWPPLDSPVWTCNDREDGTAAAHDQPLPDLDGQAAWRDITLQSIEI